MAKMRVALLAVALVLPASAALCSITASGGRLRLAGSDDLVRVAQLQLDTFDPVPDTPAEKPSLLASLFGGGGGGIASRKARAERLTLELGNRLAKGSDIYLVEEAQPGDELRPLLGAADLSEQEMLLPTHSLAEGLYLSSMAVDAGARRRGIGREMLQAALQRAAERGASGVFLHVEKANEPALRLYEGEGFVRLPASPRYSAFTSALKLSQKEPLLLFKGL